MKNLPEKINRIFYIHDIQDLWLFTGLLRPGSRILYNSVSNKISSPSKYLNQLSDFRLTPISGVNEKLNSIIDDCDQFICKECLPFTKQYIADNPNIKDRNRKKIISISWTGESCITHNQYTEGVRENYKIHFCEKQYIPIYESLGFNNLSSKIPKFYILNELTREKACALLGLDPNKKYVTFIISMCLAPEGPMSPSGTYKYLYNEKNYKIINFIQQYCAENNIVTVQKNKMKYGNENFGIKTEIFLGGDNVLYHQCLLLMAISEFSVGLSSSAALEAENINANCINFSPAEFKNINECREAFTNPAEPPHALHSLLAREPSTFNIYPSSKYENIKDLLLDFMNNSSPENFKTNHPVHEIFK